MTKVVLNVYALHSSTGSKWLSRLSLGLWHTGVEIDGKEYVFSQSMLTSLPVQIVMFVRRSD